MTVCNKKITVNGAGKKVIFDGMDFTGDALIVLTDATEVKFFNCRFYKLNPTSADTAVMETGASKEIKIVVENCFFGENPDVTENIITRVLDGKVKIADGSSFSKNYFTTGCNNGDTLSFLDIVESATIQIVSNYFEYSGAAIRLGFKGSPTATVKISNNIYFNTDLTDGGDKGCLVKFQPDTSNTTTFNNVTVEMNRNINKTPVPHMVILHAEGSDTKFNKSTNYPVVMMDGVKLTDIHATKGTTVEDAEE